MDVDADDMDISSPPSNGVAALPPVQQQQEDDSDSDLDDNCASTIVDRSRKRTDSEARRSENNDTSTSTTGLPEVHVHEYRRSNSIFPSVVKMDANDLSTLNNEQEGLLEKFYEHLQNIFRKAVILPAGCSTNERDNRCKIWKTVKAIIGWKVGDTLQSNETYYIPFNVAQEVHGVKPILYAIMIKLTLLLRLEQHRNERNRDIDFIATSSLEEYLVYLLPELIGVPIEVKSSSRKKIIAEATNQVMARLAERAQFSFNFGGIGEDYSLFGLDISMGSVSLAMLKLSGLGTAKVKLDTQRTERAPLFDRKTRLIIFKEKALQVEKSLGNTQDVSGMPEGFRLLASLLMFVKSGGRGASASRDDPYGHMTMRSTGCSSGRMNVEKHLGSGTFSHVLKLMGEVDDSVFIKIPKSSSVKESLVSEAAALKCLGECIHIPKLYCESVPVTKLDMSMGCLGSFSIPCLPLRGIIGLTANECTSTAGAGNLKGIFSAVYSALKYAHSKSWAHLDVKPANIICCCSDEGLKVMLIDWGCAEPTTSRLEGFVGTPPYAHNELFRISDGWTPRLDHDVASLMYSITSLSLGDIPWSGFSSRYPVPDDVIKERFEETSKLLKQLLDEWELSAEDKEAIFAAIDFQECTTGEW